MPAALEPVDIGQLVEGQRGHVLSLREPRRGFNLSSDLQHMI
jgi:hypothetical protein